MHWHMSVAYFNIVNLAVYADRVRPRPRLCRHFLQASIQAGNRFDFGGYVNSGTFGILDVFFVKNIFVYTCCEWRYESADFMQTYGTCGLAAFLIA